MCSLYLCVVSQGAYHEEAHREGAHRVWPAEKALSCRVCGQRVGESGAVLGSDFLWRRVRNPSARDDAPRQCCARRPCPIP